MTYSCLSNSTPTDIICHLRKGGLQSLSWFTSNFYNLNIKDETHPYVNQCSNSFACEQQLGRN